MNKSFLVILAVTYISACEPARRTADYPVITKVDVTANQVRNRNIQFIVSKPEKPLLVHMKFGVSSCEVKFELREFLPKNVIEGLKAYYPNSTFSNLEQGELKDDVDARVFVRFNPPTAEGYCNPEKCTLTTHLIAKTRIVIPEQRAVEIDKFVRSTQENIDGFGLGGWCRSLPEITTATMGEIIERLPSELYRTVESRLAK